MTKFQQKVYETVKKIPKGETRSYEWVAIQIGNPKSARAVGNALNKNRSKEIPCHRVIRKDGTIGGFASGRSAKREIIKKVAESIYIPFTVGGGINNIETIRELIFSGADKVSVNTAAVKRPEFIKEASFQFGAQCIVLAIDAKNQEGRGSKDEGRDQTWEVYIHGGRTPTGIDAVEWAKRGEELGAGEILLTSMDKDGTKDGYDLELTRAISDAVSIPVIASGGAGKLEHIYAAFDEGVADAALLASLLHYKEFTIRQIKEYLQDKGISVRI